MKQAWSAFLFLAIFLPLYSQGEPPSAEERQKLLDSTDRDCFAFDNPEKYPNSAEMMKNCTKAFKKIRHREGLKWAMVYFDRNWSQIEDARCMKHGKAERAVAKRGLENKCQFLFMDSSELCKNGKFKRNRMIEAQFVDLCADKGLALYPVKVKAGSLTCKYEFSDENIDSTPVGAFLTSATSKTGKGSILGVYGMNESNSLTKRLPALSEKDLMKKLKREQTLVVNIGPEKYHEDPSLCQNGRPPSPNASPKVNPPVEMRGLAGKK